MVINIIRYIMGNSCICSSSQINSATRVMTINEESTKKNSITRIQSRCRQHLSIKRTKTVIKNEIARFITRNEYPKALQKEIESCRWAQLIQIEKQFDKENGRFSSASTANASSVLGDSYSSQSTSSKDLKDSNAYSIAHIDPHSFFQFTMYPVYYKSLIYEGQWRYEPKTNSFIPYGIGSIIKQTGLKIESFFNDLEPIAPISRIYYPNGRIYIGEVKTIASQYLPHGKGQIHLSSGVFEMNFDKGLPVGAFTFEAATKEYIAKGAFNHSKMNRDIEITYADGLKYKGPFSYDNKHFTRKEAKNEEDKLNELKSLLISDRLLSLLNYSDIKVIQRIPNRMIQNKLKSASINLKLSHFITHNPHLNMICNTFDCKMKNVSQFISNLNKPLFIPISAYATNGGIVDYDTHFANIFNPSPLKVYFSNFYYENNRKTADIFIKGCFNEIIHEESKRSWNRADVEARYDDFSERYEVDYYQMDIFDSKVYASLTCHKSSALHFFSINEVRIKVDITPSCHIVLTNPVKSFAVFVSSKTFAQEKDEVIQGISRDDNDNETKIESKDKWKKFITDSNDIKAINFFNSDLCSIVEFNSSNSKGLFLFVELKAYNTEIAYSCKELMSHIGKEVKIVLFDQQVSIPNATKCGIDFGTIQFWGNIIEMAS